MKCTPRNFFFFFFFGNEIYYYLIFGGPVGKDGGEKREKRDGIYVLIFDTYVHIARKSTG